MSLAIPYILDAAAATNPDAVVHVVHDSLTAKDLNRRSIARAERYLMEGHTPGDRIPLPPLATVVQVVDALAAARIGLVLCDDIDLPTPAISTAGGIDRDVAESRLWSQVPLAIIGERTLTHGDVINAVRQSDDQNLDRLRPLIAVLGSIATAMQPDPFRSLR